MKFSDKNLKIQPELVEKILKENEEPEKKNPNITKMNEKELPITDSSDECKNFTGQPMYHYSNPKHSSNINVKTQEVLTQTEKSPKFSNSSTGDSPITIPTIKLSNISKVGAKIINLNKD